MRLTAILLSVLLLVGGGWSDAEGTFGLRRRNVLLFLIALYAAQMVSVSCFDGAIIVAPITLVLFLAATVFLLMRIPQGRQRFQCVLCACLFCVLTYASAVYFARQTESFLRQNTALAALVITAGAYIMCADRAAALCAACLSCFGSYTMLFAAHRILFSEALYIAAAPTTLCLFYCIFYLLVLNGTCDHLTRLIPAEKCVKS